MRLQRPGSAGRAVPLVQDAYYRDFEASGMGTAMRVHLGRDRATRIEDLFHKITATTQDVVAGAAGSPSVIDPTRQALMSLTGAAEELNRKGVAERSRIFADPSSAFGRGEDKAARAAPRWVPPRRWARRFAAISAGQWAVVLLSILAAVRGGRPGRASVTAPALC